MVKRFIITLLACFIFLFPVLTAHAEERTEKINEEEELIKSFTSKKEDFIWRGWAFTLGNNVQEIIANLGKPNKIKTKNVKNRHNPKQTDKISHLYYDWLEVATYRVGDNEKEIIVLLSIKSSRYGAKFGISIGSKRDDIINVLGKPSKQKKNLLKYEHESGYAEVNFYFRSNMVYKIEWLVFPD